MRMARLMSSHVLVAAAAWLIGMSAVGAASGAALNGVVQTGGTGSPTPLANVKVTLFEATSAQPSALGQATTNASGGFAIPYRKGSSASIFYLVADVGAGVEFVAVLGPNLPAFATINELTTIASSYSMAQFYRTGVIAGNGFGLQIAAGMNDNIAAVATGNSSPVLLSSPNADETNSLRSTRSLANLLAACVVDPDVTKSLFALTTSPGNPPPRTTSEALANLAREPGLHVDAIFALTLLSDAYAPHLVAMPDAWTVAVKVNDTGSDAKGLEFGGPGNLAFDQRGYAWVTNNVVQGTPDSTDSVVVLKPNGQPADGRKGTPVSPLTGGGLLGTGFGVTVDPKGFAWFGNFGWGSCDTCDPSLDGNGSIRASRRRAPRCRNRTVIKVDRCERKAWRRTLPAISGSRVSGMTASTCLLEATRNDPWVFNRRSEAGPSMSLSPPTAPHGCRMVSANRRAASRNMRSSTAC